MQRHLVNLHAFLRPAIRRLGLSALLPSALFAVWWSVTELGLVSPFVVPPPRDVLRALVRLIGEGYRDHSLLYHMLASLRRLAAGFGLAAAVGIPLGLWMGYRPAVRTIAYPVIEFIRPLPPLGYYAVLVVWFGIYETSKVMLLFLAAFTPIVLASLDATQRIPVPWIQAAQGMGMSASQLYRYVLWPAAAPGVYTGMRVGLGFAFTTLVAAEMVAAHAGIGWMVLDAGRYLRNDVIFAGNVLLGVTAFCLDRGAHVLRRYLVPWAYHEQDL